MTVLNNLRLVAGKKTFVGDDPAYRPLTPRERVMVLFGIFVYHLPCDLGYRLFPGMYGSER